MDSGGQKKSGQDFCRLGNCVYGKSGIWKFGAVLSKPDLIRTKLLQEVRNGACTHRQWQKRRHEQGLADSQYERDSMVRVNNFPSFRATLLCLSSPALYLLLRQAQSVIAPSKADSANWKSFSRQRRCPFDPPTATLSFLPGFFLPTFLPTLFPFESRTVNIPSFWRSFL